MRNILLRQLLDEVHVLIGSFPDLHAASDPDELPIAFILRRDAQRSARAVEDAGRRTTSRREPRYRRSRKLGPAQSWHGARRSALFPPKERT